MFLSDSLVCLLTFFHVLSIHFRHFLAELSDLACLVDDETTQGQSTLRVFKSVQRTIFKPIFRFGFDAGMVRAVMRRLRDGRASQKDEELIEGLIIVRAKKIKKWGINSASQQLN